MAGPIRFDVDPGGELGRNFRKAIDSVEDLRVPLSLIRESWFRGNKSIFALAGPGKFADLSPNYKKRKAAKFGSPYPILFRQQGILRDALTVPGNAKSVSKLVGKKALDLGVDPDDIVFNSLYSGTRTGIKARPYILLGVEQTAPSALNTRVAIWRKLIVDYVSQVTGESFGE